MAGARDLGREVGRVRESNSKRVRRGRVRRGEWKKRGVITGNKNQGRQHKAIDYSYTAVH